MRCPNGNGEHVKSTLVVLRSLFIERGHHLDTQERHWRMVHCEEAKISQVVIIRGNVHSDGKGGTMGWAGRRISVLPL